MTRYKLVNHKCAKIYNRGRLGFLPCSHQGVVRRDGKWWCERHDPVVIAARKRRRKRFFEKVAGITSGAPRGPFPPRQEFFWDLEDEGTE